MKKLLYNSDFQFALSRIFDVYSSWDFYRRSGLAGGSL